MARVLQIRRGTTQENRIFIGDIGELTYDTEKKDLRVRDGQTAGGFRVPTLIASMQPTSSNDYTWYRKWSDGWIEQGQYYRQRTAATTTINLPVAMNSGNYSILTSGTAATTYSNVTQNSFKLNTTANAWAGWEVKGMWQ